MDLGMAFSILVKVSLDQKQRLEVFWEMPRWHLHLGRRRSSWTREHLGQGLAGLGLCQWFCRAWTNLTHTTLWWSSVIELLRRPDSSSQVPHLCGCDLCNWLDQTRLWSVCCKIASDAVCIALHFSILSEMFCHFSFVLALFVSFCRCSKRSLWLMMHRLHLWLKGCRMFQAIASSKFWGASASSSCPSYMYSQCTQHVLRISQDDSDWPYGSILIRFKHV